MMTSVENSNVTDNSIFGLLPDEVLLMIFNYLAPPKNLIDIYSICQVSKRFNRIGKDIIQEFNDCDEFIEFLKKPVLDAISAVEKLINKISKQNNILNKAINFFMNNSTNINSKEVIDLIKEYEIAFITLACMRPANVSVEKALEKMLKNYSDRNVNEETLKELKTDLSFTMDALEKCIQIVVERNELSVKGKYVEVLTESDNFLRPTFLEYIKNSANLWNENRPKCAAPQKELTFY